VENTYVGPFLIVKKLGSNRRQKVYHARQTEQDRDVALKFISVPPKVEWGKALDKINREVIELQKLRHNNLVAVYGAGVAEENKIFFATELVEGESLTSILSRRGKLTTDLVVEYGQQIAEVLRYLHSLDLIHSKLTPKKILVTPDHKIKITDLRLNRSNRRRWDATRKRELDIAAYMAPEQFTAGASRKSDFYSLGVILFEMLTGKLPYPPDTMGRMKQQKLNAPVPSVVPHLLNCPIWLDKIITQMLSPDPNKRPHSARAISMALDEIKNIDATKKAAVSQLSGGFNPLTVGQDKTEARRLLGMKKKKKKKDHELPFYKQVPFQIVALLSIFGFVGFMLLVPKNHQKIVDEVKTLVASNRSSEWTEARIAIEPVMNSDGPLAQEAEELYYQSFRKSFVYHAEHDRSTRLDSESFQLFSQAVRCERNDELDEAIKIYSGLVATIEPDGKERHVYWECEARLERLRGSEDLPLDHDQLSQLISQACNTSPTDQLVAAHDLLVRIQMRFAGEAEYEGIVSQASRELKIIKQRITNENRAGDQDAESMRNRFKGASSSRKALASQKKVRPLKKRSPSPRTFP